MHLTVKTVLAGITLSMTGLAVLEGAIGLGRPGEANRRLSGLAVHGLPAARVAGDLLTRLAHFHHAESVALIALDEDTKNVAVADAARAGDEVDRELAGAASGTGIAAADTGEVAMLAEHVGVSAGRLMALSAGLESKSAMLATEVGVFVTTPAG